jgi:hypothetical protein
VPATPRTLTFTDEDLAQAQEEREKRARLRALIEGRVGSVAEPVVSDPTVARFYTMEELSNMPPPRWLISNIVEEGGLTLFYSPDKMGKTALLSSLLWAYCTGKDSWLHSDFKMYDPSEGERSVAYVLLEGHATYYYRYKAWADVYNDGNYPTNFWTAPEGLNLFVPGMNVEKPETWGDSVKELYRFIEQMRPTILVIDTFSRATAGINENSSEIAQVVNWFDFLRDQFGTTTIVVHHTPLEDTKRPRGHSSLKGAASSYVRISPSDGPNPRIHTLWHGPHRNAETGDHGYDFTMVSTEDAFYIQASSEHVRSLGPREEQVLNYLKEHGGSVDFPTMSKELGIDKANLRRLINNSGYFERISGEGNNPSVVKVVLPEHVSDL